jgi:hypothetical protein
VGLQGRPSGNTTAFGALTTGPYQLRINHLDASGAGLTLLVIAGALVAGGAWLGHAFGASVAGGLVGGFFGVVLGFVAIYARYRTLQLCEALSACSSSSGG